MSADRLDLGFNYDVMKSATIEALGDPRPGDRYHEMYSFWLYVVAVDGDAVVTLEACALCTFPDDGKQKTQSRQEFRDRMMGQFGSPWVLLADRDNNVEGWA